MAINTLTAPTTKSRYTYDQFRQAAEQSGLLGEFSDADLSLAQRNPDAGMSLLSYKRDWHNATTDAEEHSRQLRQLYRRLRRRQLLSRAAEPEHV